GLRALRPRRQGGARHRRQWRHRPRPGGSPGAGRGRHRHLGHQRGEERGRPRPPRRNRPPHPRTPLRRRRGGGGRGRLRRNPRAIRPGRWLLRQCRHLRRPLRPLRRTHEGAVGPRAPREPHRRLPHLPRRRPPHARPCRCGRQGRRPGRHRLARCDRGRCPQRALRRIEGRHGLDDPRARGGAGPPRHPRPCHPPRLDRDGDDRPLRRRPEIRRQRPASRADAPLGHGRGFRRHRRLPDERRERLPHRRQLRHRRRLLAFL
ncbi:MAG: Short-chain dehydrogenase/reductase SDR, partial [uncultured Craurococcus sp.]